VKKTGSFRDALIFVAGAALLAIFSYVVIVGDIKRLELQPEVRPQAG
jgi:ACS family glucarate transporter-like MFS transporter